MRRGDELARRRQALPWVPLEKEYVFATADGRRTLAGSSTAARNWSSTLPRVKAGVRASLMT
jgi:Bacterial protein of unknown function (DUF899)